MKKIVLFFALALTSVFSYGQSQRELLRLGLSAANSELPMANGFITIEKLELVGDDIVFYTTIDEEMVTLDELSSGYSRNKSDVIANAFANNRDFAEVIKEYGVGVRYIISGNRSKNKLDLQFSNEDLMVALDNPVQHNDIVKGILADTNKGLPMDMGYGMQMTEIFMENNYLCYQIKVDESIMTLSLLKFMEKDYIDAAVSYAKNVTNPDEQMMFEYLRENNFGMKYVFGSDTSSETVTMTITPELLK